MSTSRSSAVRAGRDPAPSAAPAFRGEAASPAHAAPLLLSRVLAASRGVPPRDVLHLQRTLGNRAVGRLLDARRVSPAGAVIRRTLDSGMPLPLFEELRHTIQAEIFDFNRLEAGLFEPGEINPFALGEERTDLEAEEKLSVNREMEEILDSVEEQTRDWLERNRESPYRARMEELLSDVAANRRVVRARLARLEPRDEPEPLQVSQGLGSLSTPESLGGARMVDMTEYAHSDTPMFSSSYANCLGLVVHDRRRRSGALGHVFPGSAGSANPEPYVQLYVNTMEKMIGRMVDTGSEEGDLDLVLFASFQYVPEQEWYVDWARDLVVRAHGAVRVQDRRPPRVEQRSRTDLTTQDTAFYFPATGRLVLGLSSESQAVREHLETHSENRVDSVSPAFGNPRFDLDTRTRVPDTVPGRGIGEILELLSGDPERRERIETIKKKNGGKYL